MASFNKQVKNVLVLVDDRGSGPSAGQSGILDTVLIPSVNRQNGSVTVFDVPQNALKNRGKSAAREVSELLFGLPVCGYISAKSDLIPWLNDYLGGISLNLTENLTNGSPAWREGAEITLKGEDCRTFLRCCRIYEAVSGLESASMRRYFALLLLKTREKVTKNPMQGMTLLKKLKSFTETDLSVFEILSLVTDAAKSGSNDIDMRKVPGRISGETGKFTASWEEVRKLFEETGVLA